ncbi:MAG: hypothetical protein A2V81_00450 [Candidatus Abawacabacteria bacterium RBG_16_42_10]|uniref:DUF2207 domain-containing protein n=1 Tax=Candidatus Abawacabacteria bacterium RBG_16_42_10 TaxID=1817814 RepID=A0A1F4XJA2_9BACT|nr:MAG: hypothetical protein A2V81_00450 [Candidatus Abawacabacteria bacterium RBG_16_42_10]
MIGWCTKIIIVLFPMRLAPNLKKFLTLSIFTVLFLSSVSVLAANRDVSKITDWYIKDFQTEIIVNKDSTLFVTEKITADAGNLPDKHGIFRILPTFYQKTVEERVPLLVELISITDFSGEAHPYSTITDDDTITWKIGDANRTVKGENYYLITYQVKNVLRFDNPRFDEFYWNLLGTFWQIDIDNFTAAIKFPPEVSQANTQIDYYTGYFGGKTKDQATYSWLDDHTLQFTSTSPFYPQQGITASVTFPKGIAVPYQFSFWELYSAYVWFLIPLILFVFLFRSWYIHGRDLRVDKTVIAEYEAPEKLTPMEVAALLTNGSLQNSAISAAIVDLAIKKILKIEQTQEKTFLKNADFKLSIIGTVQDIARLTEAEKLVVVGLFESGNQIMLSSLMKRFASKLAKIKTNVRDSLVKRGFFTEKGFTMQVWYMTGGMFLFIVSFLPAVFSLTLMAALIISAIMLFAFGALMPKRTAQGTEALWKAKGFKLFIETAEKYRQAFNEREHIFEEVLPYAMVFGVVAVWIKNMQKIYGEEYFHTYHPYWYTGAAMRAFNADAFASSLQSLSTNMANTIASSPSSSGSRGGGSSGGGGGGGGGGGW